MHVEGATGAWAISTWLCGLPAPAGRQQPRVHMMSRWRSACAGTKRQCNQWGEGSSRRSEYGEARGTCPIQERVSVIHGSDTHHAYRPTEDVVSGGQWRTASVTFRVQGSTSGCCHEPPEGQSPEAGKRHKLARRVVRQANSVGEAGPLAIAHDHKSEHANISVGEVLANGKTGL